ncbi:hypothetical protein HMPREF1039_0119 [Megasphaera lornae]|uniref:Uncharacterized protein n=1 Tax=Megasphaera lornae TaxID=1000568 RepID=A0ABN0D2G9_9FIRM|nr:hypothetical protein HMPREF1039_0119 [Megasphaera lornae]
MRQEDIIQIEKWKKFFIEGMFLPVKKIKKTSCFTINLRPVRSFKNMIVYINEMPIFSV